MRNLLLWCMLMVMGIPCYAQKVNTVSCDNYVTQAFKNVFIEMPDYREVNSGSKLVVTYEGEWPAEMRGAFEYAVKIWEEVLPMTLPINLTAKAGALRGSANLLSRVTFDTYEYNNELVNRYASPMSMIKSVLLKEYHSRQQHRFYDEITDTSIFDGPDMTITYNETMIDQFDFSLDGEPNLAKYDFVTVALRDIAIGLGFTTSFTADVANKRLNITGGRLTPFESRVMEALGTSDPYTAFANATKGSVEIPLSDWGGIHFDSISVYAPETWTNGSSLRYLIPDDNPISRLLTYDFGKGYIMRDLSGVNWDDIFCGALDWRIYLTTGIGSGAGSVSQTGSSLDVFPYKGQVSLSFNEENQGLSMGQDEDIQNNMSDSGGTQQPQLHISEGLPTNDYCKKYDSYSPSGPAYRGISLSVLKKDGSWDCVYSTGYTSEPIVVNIEDLKLNCADSEYARGTTGGLRYRLTQCEEVILYGKEYYSYKVKYFTRDYTPQKAVIKYTKDPSGQYAVTLNEVSGDNRFIDVKVGISNLEGTTKVIVEQLDEGETLPFQYEVDDFRKGYFIANLDRECSTKLTAVCYNENGYQRSNTITIPAIGYPTKPLKFIRMGNYIQIEGLPDIVHPSDKVIYTIKDIAHINGFSTSGLVKDGRVNIGLLPNGTYGLSIKVRSKLIGTYKFVK